MSYYPGVDTYTAEVTNYCEDCDFEYEIEVEVERGQYETKCPKCGSTSNREVSE